MASTLEMIRSHRDEILTLAAKYGISDIRIFGSVAREEENNNSDIDLLVSISPDRSLTDLSRFRLEMTKLVNLECDLVSERGLHHLLQSKILSEAKPL